jgi:small basic protein (TIGR04137 family)
MSIDRSLRGANMLVRHRNVLNRVERLEQLHGEEKWEDGKSVFNLPKVGHRKQVIVKAAKEAVAAEGATPDAGAPVAGAASAAGVAPAAGAKAAAPAAKGAAPAAKPAAKK